MTILYVKTKAYGMEVVDLYVNSQHMGRFMSLAGAWTKAQELSK